MGYFIIIIRDYIYYLLFFLNYLEVKSKKVANYSILLKID